MEGTVTTLAALTCGHPGHKAPGCPRLHLRVTRAVTRMGCWVIAHPHSSHRTHPLAMQQQQPPECLPPTPARLLPWPVPAISVTWRLPGLGGQTPAAGGACPLDHLAALTPDDQASAGAGHSARD